MPRRTDRRVALSMGIGIVLGAGTLGWGLAGAVEDGARTRVETLFHAAGLGWAELSMDGTITRLAGTAPDAGAALTAVNLVRQAGRYLVLEDAIAVEGAAQAAQRPRPVVFSLDVLRDEQGVALGGRAPSAAAHAGLLQALAEQPGLGQPVDLARDLAAETPAYWPPMQRMAVVAARALLHGRVTLSPRRVAITGLPRNVIGRDAIEREADHLRAAGIAVILDLVAPPSAADRPPTLIAEHGRRGVKLIDCKAPDAGSAAALEAVLAATPPQDATATRWRCRGTGKGADDAENWVAAATVSLAALAEAPAARLEIDGHDVRLIPGADTIGQSFETALRILREELPAGFNLVALSAGPNAEASRPRPRFWLRVRRTEAGVTLSGLAPDTATRAAVTSYAAARFGLDAVTDTMTVEEGGTVPEGWRTAALAALDAIQTVERGEALIREQKAYLWGNVQDASSVRAAHAALDGVEAQGWMRTTRITVDLPSRIAALKLAPDACVALVQATVSEAPILFAPSSARIDSASQETLDQLATDLAQCAPTTLEVGGHTDSQGSVAYNNRLSAARAEAVRTALAALGTGSVRLTAVGYGPSKPIADNATEAGRALNRRIAFRALPPPDPDDQPSDNTGARL